LGTEGGACGVDVEAGDLDPERLGDVAGLRGRCPVGRRAAGNHNAYIIQTDSRTRDGHLGSPTSRLGVRVHRSLDCLSRLTIVGGADVVEGQHRAAGANSHPFHNPRVRGANVEILEKLVRNLDLRIEMSDSVYPEHDTDSLLWSGRGLLTTRDLTRIGDVGERHVDARHRLKVWNYVAGRLLCRPETTRPP